VVTNGNIQHNETEEDGKEQAQRMAKKTSNVAILEGGASGFKVVSVDLVVDIPTEVAGSLDK